MIRNPLLFTDGFTRSSLVSGAIFIYRVDPTYKYIHISSLLAQVRKVLSRFDPDTIWSVRALLV